VRRLTDLALAATAFGWVVEALLHDALTTAVMMALAALHLTVGMLFVVRRRSAAAGDWRDAALCGASVVTGGLALGAAPPPSQWPAPAEALFVVATAGAIAGLLSLGRSFGVLPASRGVVRHGPFRLLRHPIYAAELTMVAACGLAASSPAGALVVVLACASVVLRIRIEERLLSGEAAYRVYRDDVRWRLIPGVW
jgi:protein-S-isoprenylcysteine O-methyltransferase Ste14